MQEPLDSSLVEVSAPQSLAVLAPQVQLKEDHVFYFIPQAHMPLELAFLILSFLDVKSWRLAAQVCKNWHFLADDHSLWQSQEAYYKQDSLWRYLFKEPSTNGYQRYMAEVLHSPELNYSNLFLSLWLLEDQALKHAESTSLSAELANKKILIHRYFETIDFGQLGASLLDLPNRIAQLPPEYLEEAPLPHPIEGAINRSQALSILAKTHSIEVLLTELLFLNKFLSSYDIDFIRNLIESPINRLFEDKKAIQLQFALKSYYLIRYIPTATLVLLSKLNGDELIDCTSYCDDLALFILEQPKLINSLNNNQLLTVFSKFDSYRLVRNFLQLLEKNKTLLARLNAEFLIKLCQLNSNNAKDLPFLILTHAILIDRLSSDQISKLINDAKKFRSLTIQNVLHNEVFQRHVAKSTNPRALLLSLPTFRELYKLDWTVALLTSEEPLNAVNNAVKEEEDFFSTERDNKKYISLSEPNFSCTYSYMTPKLKITVRPVDSQKKNGHALPPIPPTPTSTISKIGSIASLVGLGFLLGISTLLLITGFGSLVGVPLLLTSLAAINIFPISTSILCSAALITGVCTTLISTTLLYDYCTSPFSKQTPLKKLTCQPPSASSTPTSRLWHSSAVRFKKLTDTPDQAPRPALPEEIRSFANRPGF